MMDKKVDATDIQIGMFISQLDRPWTDTPFMLQGFLVETDEDLAQVRDYCQHVYIDLGKSIGREYEYEAALARNIAPAAAIVEGPMVHKFLSETRRSAD